MIATLLAGYPAPCVLGLAAAALVASGHHVLLLGGGIVMLAALLVTVRNLFAVVAIVLTAAALVGLVGWAPTAAQEAGMATLAWVLLFGGLRSVVDLPRSRRAARGRTDADQLAGLTYVPAPMWMLLFAGVALAAVATAALWLVRW